MNKIEKIPKVRPAYIPMKCPVCSGFKTVGYNKQICSICDGKGWVPVPLAKEEEEAHGNNK